MFFDKNLKTMSASKAKLANKSVSEITRVTFDDENARNVLITKIKKYTQNIKNESLSYPYLPYIKRMSLSLNLIFILQISKDNLSVVLTIISKHLERIFLLLYLFSFRAHRSMPFPFFRRNPSQPSGRVHRKAHPPRTLRYL